MSKEPELSAVGIGSLITLAVFLVLGIVAGAMVGCPVSNVYRAGKTGEAELKRAEQNRQIMVQSAQAKKEAATFEKDAEIIAAEGRAAAMKIMQEPLTELTDAQARVLILYNWVKGLTDESSQVIYVPTEANLPIFLEAGRVAEMEGLELRGPPVSVELGRDVSSEDEELDLTTSIEISLTPEPTATIPPGYLVQESFREGADWIVFVILFCFD